MISELSVELRAELFGRRYGVFKTIVTASGVHNSLEFDIDAPLLLSDVPTDPLYSRGIVTRELTVPHVLGVGRCSKITPSIIERVSIYVVYVILRPLAHHVQPSDSMFLVLGAENVYFSPVPGYCSGWLIGGRPHNPSEDPSFWAVVNQFFELLLGKIGMIVSIDHCESPVGGSAYYTIRGGA